MLKNVFRPIELSSVDSATFDGTYKVLTAGLPQACVFIRIVNNSDEDITISFDGGTTDHDFVPADGVLELFCQEGAQPPAYISLLEKGTAISANGVKTGTGLVYLSGYYLPHF